MKLTATKSNLANALAVAARVNDLECTPGRAGRAARRDRNGCACQRHGLRYFDHAAGGHRVRSRATAACCFPPGFSSMS